MSEESKSLVEAYERCFDENQVNVDLIVHILTNIHESGKKGILIFIAYLLNYFIYIFALMKIKTGR